MICRRRLKRASSSLSNVILPLHVLTHFVRLPLDRGIGRLVCRLASLRRNAVEIVLRGRAARVVVIASWRLKIVTKMVPLHVPRVSPPLVAEELRVLLEQGIDALVSRHLVSGLLQRWSEFHHEQSTLRKPVGDRNDLRRGVESELGKADGKAAL